MQSPYPIEAEYEDGYVHNENEWADSSPYEAGRNVFYDILHKLPEAEHGKMIRFSLHILGERLDVDWTNIPSNAKPIRFTTFELQHNTATGEDSPTQIVKIVFGFEYLDEKTGRNVQEVREIT